MRNAYKGFNHGQVMSILVTSNAQMLNRISQSLMYSVIASSASSLGSGWY